MNQPEPLAAAWLRRTGDFLVPLLVDVAAELRAKAEVVEGLGDVSELFLNVVNIRVTRLNVR
jgi:hypothetical protein